MSPLEDDFTPDPDPLPIDGDEDSLNRLAEAEPGEEYQTCDECLRLAYNPTLNSDGNGGVRCDDCASFESLLEVPAIVANGAQGWCETHGQYYTPGKGCLMCEIEKEAGADRIRQAREVETNIRAELEAQRAEERKAAGICTT